MLAAIRSEWSFDKSQGWALWVRLYNAAWIARDELRKARAS
jgi:hypothetical protein